ncbi:MAG: hypothetical protein AABZ74_05130 [Cyanobacteriota bacterium]
MTETPLSKKINLNASQDLSAFMSMGLPPEVLMTLTSIKEASDIEKENETIKTKKVFVENQQKDLSHLHGMGLPDEVIQTLRGIKSEDFKNQKAQSEAKQAQLLSQQQFTKSTIPPGLSGMKFNPLTGGFNVPKELLDKANNIKNVEIDNREEILTNQNIVNFDNLVPQIKKEEVIPELPFEIPTMSLSDLVSSMNSNISNDNNNISVSETINYSENESKQVENALIRSMQISEEGVFLGIILNLTKKSEAIEILNKQCKTQFSHDYDDNIISYELDGINMYIEEDLVLQLEFKRGFEGSTVKGLKIGDNVEKALELYGKPVMKTPKGAVWKNFKVFYEKDIIHSIKIQR